MLEDVRSMEGLGRILTLGGEPGEVDLSRCSTARLLALPAWAAKHSLGPHVTLGALIPPFLLCLAPHLCSAAELAVERHIDVVPALDEIRCAVAIGWVEVLRIDQDMLLRQFASRACFSAARAGLPKLRNELASCMTALRRRRPVRPASRAAS